MDLDRTINRLTEQCGEWLRGSGPESDIVISSRIRLARNLADFPFIRRCTEHDRTAIEKGLRDKLLRNDKLAGLIFMDVAHMESVDRQFLVERQLISRELAESNGARSVAIDSARTVQPDGQRRGSPADPADEERTGSGKAWEQINDIDDLIESHVNFAFHERLGYLTACPPTSAPGCGSA